MVEKSLKSIYFLMPGYSNSPVGGYKIVYEYANRLVDDGYDVTIVYPLYLGGLGEENVWKFCLRHPRAGLKTLIGGIIETIKNRNLRPTWMPMDARIKYKRPIAISSSLFKSDKKEIHVFSTYVLTALALKNINGLHKYQFIQGRENWGSVSLDMLHEIYKLSMRKIAVAEWLVEEVASVGESCAYIPNAVDTNRFHLEAPVKNRKSTEVAMLWNTHPCKRVEDALAAISIAREKHPDIHISAFGTCPEPTNLPSYVTYYQSPDNATHNAIYNNAAIFVAASDFEGWGLTVSEAMLCGAAIACTDTSGFKSFCKNEETALMSPVYDVDALANNICRLIEDDELRYRIANAGMENIRKFTWERSYSLLKKVIEESYGI